MSLHVYNGLPILPSTLRRLFVVILNVPSEPHTLDRDEAEFMIL